MKQQMKGAVLAVALAGALSFPQSGVAQDARIAVVDIQQLTLGSDEGRAASEKWNKRYEEIVAIMRKSQQDIEEKENRLKTQDRVMSATVKAQLTKEIETDKVNFDRKNQDYQQEMAILEAELLDPVSQKAQVMLAAYVKEKGFGLLFDLSAEGGNVVWSNPANDITPDVIKRLNEEFKKAASAAPAAKAQTP
jgi:Skp family chaperone for outer membrane proteins